MTFDRKFDSLFVLFLRPWLPSRVLFKQWKQSFLLDEMLYILFLFHSTETNGTFFCVVVLLLAVKHQRFIGWQSNLWSSNSSILYQISCLKFHTEYRALWLLLNALLGRHPKEECGVSARYKHQTAFLLLKTFSKDVFDHLNGCYKTTSAGVEVEWMFAYIELTCLTRLEIPLPFAPFTEMSLVLDGDQAKLTSIHCTTALKQKPVRGVTYKILCEIGQG